MATEIGGMPTTLPCGEGLTSCHVRNAELPLVGSHFFPTRKPLRCVCSAGSVRTCNTHGAQSALGFWERSVVPHVCETFVSLLCRNRFR